MEGDHWLSHLSPNPTRARYTETERWMKVRELIALIEANGWFQVRMKGSHRQFHHPIHRGTVTIAGKPGGDVPPGTLNSVLEQAGLKGRE